MRVAIVNDLLTITETLRRIVMSEPTFQVAWVASDGARAVHLAETDPPDVILMDLQMPGMNGAQTTAAIMKRSPCQILIVTSSVMTNYSLVCEAMGHGAYDAINTPGIAPGQSAHEAGKELFAKLSKAAKVSRSGFIKRPELLKNATASGDSGVFRVTSAGSDSGIMKAPAAASSSSASSKSSSTSGVMPGIRAFTVNFPIIAIGVSTGGPPALQTILTALPADLPAAVIIIQHISPEFVPALVQFLSERCPLKVTAAQEGEQPRIGQVYLAQSNDHLVLKDNGTLGYTPDPVASPYRPSVDAMFESLAKYGPRIGAAALLTGIGRDGANGLLKLKQRGWLTIAQDEASSVVFGMPSAAINVGAAQRVLPLKEIANHLVPAISQSRSS